jgi:hypothetical protein
MQECRDCKRTTTSSIASSENTKSDWSMRYPSKLVAKKKINAERGMAQCRTSTPFIHLHYPTRIRREITGLRGILVSTADLLMMPKIARLPSGATTRPVVFCLRPLTRKIVDRNFSSRFISQSKDSIIFLISIFQPLPHWSKKVKKVARDNSIRTLTRSTFLSCLTASPIVSFLKKQAALSLSWKRSKTTRTNNALPSTVRVSPNQLKKSPKISVPC